MITASVLFQGTGFFSYAEESYRNVDTVQKIYDYADLLTSDEEAEVQKECERLIQSYGYDVFVVTIDENDISYASEDRSLSFLEDFGDQNGFGLGDEQNYVAFLIDMDERQYSIDVKGETCFLIYSDQIQEQILDDVYYDMKNGDYPGAVWTFLENVDERGIKQVSGFVGTAEEYEEYERELKRETFWGSVLMSVFGSVLLGCIVGAIVTFSKRMKSKTVYTSKDASNYVEEGSFKRTENSDQFIRRYKTTRVIQTSSGGGGGGGSHHTTTHRSSGGSSHSGRSRSF